MELCPNCKHPKEREDFYWRKYNSNWKVYEDCKDCILRKAKEKNDQRIIQRQDPLYAYFH